MRTDRISFRILPEMRRELDGLAKLGQFKNLSRLMFALCIVAIQNDRRGQGFYGPRQSWVRDLANADPVDQDYVVRHMLNWPQEFSAMLAFMKKIDATKTDGRSDTLKAGAPRRRARVKTR
jgi:hypothetical protein